MRISFRVRLSLWNMAILALVLVGFGSAICYRVQASMAAAIDQELAERAHRMEAGRARFERWRRRPGHDDGKPEHGPAPPHQTGSSGARPPQGLASGPPPEPPPDRAPNPANAVAAANATTPLDADTERIAALRRPRFLDLKGKNLGPFNKDGPWDKSSFERAVKGQVSYATITVGLDHLRVYSAPIRDPGPAGQTGHIMGVLQLARELTMYDRLLADQIRILFTLVPLALLITGASGLFLTNRALRPVHDVTQVAAEIGAHDLGRRLEVNGHDELAELASTFNGMIARLHDSFGNLERAYARLEAAYEQQRRFTADASHELRTPLARIKGSTSLALVGEWSEDEYRQAIAVADDAADKMHRIIQDLLLLARSDAGQSTELYPMDLSVILENTVTCVPNPDDIPVRLDLPDQPLEVLGDADHLSRVFCNLMENALRHTPPGGSITISGRATGGHVLAGVEDTGEGIAAEHLPHLFERFYRIDAARSRSQGGTGLGLAISQSIIHAHEGTIAIESEAGQGTRVIVTLPHAAAATSASRNGSHHARLQHV